MRFIFTCQEACRELTLYEFKLYDPSFIFTGWLDREVGLAETALDNTALSALIRSAPIIFVRHIFAADITLQPNDEFITQLAALCSATAYYGSTVSVQVRACEKPCIAPEGLAERIAVPLGEAGFTPDLKEGEDILSVYIAENSIYAGLGNACENLSKWRGGMPFYSKSSGFGFVSRAEYKLAEALESFNINFEGIKTALDLGAAPGGWTKALLDRGAAVISVDPNRLDPSLRGDRRIKYYPMTAERYLKLCATESFNIIVDDMKLDADKSLAIVKRFYGRLVSGGYAVITLKLEHGFCYKTIRDCMSAVRPFEVVGARQLFHNRSEVTLVLQKNK